jgi:hypothetical protein
MPLEMLQEGLHLRRELTRARVDGVDIAALEVRLEDGDWDVDRGADRSELQLNGNFAKLLNAACAGHAAVAYESGRLAVPLRIDPIEGVLEYRRRP